MLVATSRNLRSLPDATIAAERARHVIVVHRVCVCVCVLPLGFAPAADPSVGRRLGTDQVSFDGDQLYTRLRVSPMSVARSLSDRRSVTRNASTPCL